MRRVVFGSDGLARDWCRANTTQLRLKSNPANRRELIDKLVVLQLQLREVNGKLK